MTSAPGKFDFADAKVLSLADVIEQVAADPAFPETRRATVRSSLTRLAKWSGRRPETIAFAEPVIESLLERLRADVLGISAKRLANARSDIRFVLDRYTSKGRYLAPFSPEAQRLWQLLATKYEQCSLSRLLRFLSARGIDPAAITDDVSSAFLLALRNEARLRIKPETFHQSSIRAWNKAVVSYPSWPQVTLSAPCYKTSKMTPWAELPKSLEREVDAFLAAGSDAPGASLFDESIPLQRVKPATASTQKDHIRCAASALILAGRPAATLTGFREIVAPTNFRLALEWTIAMRDKRIGGYVATLAWTLVKCARYAKVLSSAEVEEVNQLYRRLSARRKAEKPLDTRRDEALLAQLDDPRVMDALLSLPSRTVERIIRSGRTDRMAALEVQKACALAIWLCAPLRLSNFVSLRLDQHFHRLQLKGKKLVLVRLSLTEVKNAEALEHFLSEEAAALLELYVRDFRPHLCGLGCQWLVPGYGDGHKVAAAFSDQMKKYIEAATGVDFHPHLMRKIAAKICLDEDPAAIEIVRRCLGHRNTNTTRQSYTQAQQRAAQTRYLDMLEKRQLGAIGGWKARTKP